MRLSWRQSSRSQDRFEKEIAQHYQRRVLAGDVVSTGPCPDEDFLRRLARHSKRLELTDPKVDHAASCPLCVKRLLALRKEYRQRCRIWIVVGVIAGLLLVGVTFFFVIWH